MAGLGWRRTVQDHYPRSVRACSRGSPRVLPTRSAWTDRVARFVERRRSPTGSSSPNDAPNQNTCSVLSTWSPSEAHLPAEDPATCTKARIPSPHVRSCGSGDHQGPPPQGSSPSLGLRVLGVCSMERLTDRDSFRGLRSEGCRTRSGPLSIVVRHRIDRTRPAVGFAISKRVGTAVTRNRLRRRLREIFRELERSGNLAGGDYLVVAAPDAASCGYTTLREHVTRAVGSVGPACARDERSS